MAEPSDRKQVRKVVRRASGRSASAGSETTAPSDTDSGASNAVQPTQAPQQTKPVPGASIPPGQAPRRRAVSRRTSQGESLRPSASAPASPAITQPTGAEAPAAAEHDVAMPSAAGDESRRPKVKKVKKVKRVKAEKVRKPKAPKAGGRRAAKRAALDEPTSVLAAAADVDPVASPEPAPVAAQAPAPVAAPTPTPSLPEDAEPAPTSRTSTGAKKSRRDKTPKTPKTRSFTWSSLGPRRLGASAVGGVSAAGGWVVDRSLDVYFIIVDFFQALWARVTGLGLSPTRAAAVVGAVVGLQSTALATLSILFFRLVRGVSTGGGLWGTIVFVLIIVAAVYSGAWLLRSVEIASERVVSWLAVLGGLAVLILAFLGVVSSPWAWLLMPALGAVAYAGAEKLIRAANEDSSGGPRYTGADSSKTTRSASSD